MIPWVIPRILAIYVLVRHSSCLKAHQRLYVPRIIAFCFIVHGHGLLLCHIHFHSVAILAVFVNQRWRKSVKQLGYGKIDSTLAHKNYQTCEVYLPHLF